MKRILLLIILVMMATYFLRDRHDRRPDPEINDLVVALAKYRRTAGDNPLSCRGPAEDVIAKFRKAIGDHRQSRLVPDKDFDVIDPDGPPEIRNRLVKKSPVDPPIRTISSGLMATEDRATADAIHKLEQSLSEWLEPEIPTDWKPSKKLVQSMIREVTYTPVVRDYGTLYVAELAADTSSQRREAIVAEYRDEMVQHRMLALGGSLAFVLVCLGIISGYIRADEATRGYYTNRLRMLAAAGVGAAGVAVYRFMA